jgi:hypothetical protein
MKIDINYDGTLCIKELNGMIYPLSNYNLCSRDAQSYFSGNIYDWSDILSGRAYENEVQLELQKKDNEMHDRVFYLEERFKEFEDSIPSKLTKLGF